jgi:hypothetical protein
MSQTFITDVPVMGVARDSTYIDAYVNQIRLSANLGDLTLVFGVVEDLGPGRIVNKDRATIRLSMTTAKALQLNLQAAISGYEAAVGPIPLSGGVSTLIDQIRPQIEASLRQQLGGQPPSEDDAPGAA